MVMHLEESLHTFMIRLPAQRVQALQSYIVHRTWQTHFLMRLLGLLGWTSVLKKDMLVSIWWRRQVRSFKPLFLP